MYTTKTKYGHMAKPPRGVVGQSLSVWGYGSSYQPYPEQTDLPKYKQEVKRKYQI
jgi:hypothetical protein